MPQIPANPLLQPWTSPFGLPPFPVIRAEHFVPAFDHALRAHAGEVQAIATSDEPPSFDNTVAALDRSGRALKRIEMLFGNLTASETSVALQAVEREMMPRLAAHHNAIHLDAALFARIDAIEHRRGELALDPERSSLLERIHLDFVRAGAKLGANARQRLHQIVSELATLHTRFSQNLLADEARFELVLRSEGELAGLPDQVRAAARSAALARGPTDAWVVTLSRSLVVPFLTYSDRRDLREVAFKAWTNRGGNDGPHDNRDLARRILALRNEQARLHGYSNYAEYALVDRMAGTPDAVADLLSQVWVPAKAKAIEERDALQAMARTCGQQQAIEPWDWRYYAEKVRKARYDCDDALIKPYFALDRMLEAAFDCANRLFGLSFVERHDIATYHPDVRVFEVHDREQLRAIFLSDNFARPTKRGGAWMSLYRFQSKIDGDVTPIVVNNNNFAKAPDGEPTLLSADDVRTLFHEFGHGLHGMLSQVSFERLSGTRVLRDFVELPSQLFEHWAEERDVLKRHARHHRSGAPIPDALLDKLRAAQLSSQGFETVE
jgi:peptidyl-dipeptidase Dcp